MTKRRTRPPVKQDAIVRYVRSAIIEGDLAVGDKVPPRTAIERQFGVSSVTVQRAFDRLSSDGFIEVRGNGGTFVSEELPHRCRYGIAFRRAFGSEDWSQWFTVILHVAANLENGSGRSLPHYTEVDEHVKSKDYQKLARDVRARCLAGIVFVGEPQLSDENPLLTAETISRVVFSSSPHVRPGSVRVDLGGATGFLERALDYLESRGRSRIAMLCMRGTEPERLEFYHSHAAQLGLRTEPYWTHGIEVSGAYWTANIAHLLFRQRPEDRPDGLIVSDDNLVEHAFRGLVEAGVQIPKDVEIVAHCNFPVPQPPGLPVARLGYDTRRALETCIELIDKQNEKQPVPEYTAIPPSFEWELPNRM